MAARALPDPGEWLAQQSKPGPVALPNPDEWLKKQAAAAAEPEVHAPVAGLPSPESWLNQQGGELGGDAAETSNGQRGQGKTLQARPTDAENVANRPGPPPPPNIPMPTPRLQRSVWHGEPIEEAPNRPPGEMAEALQTNLTGKLPPSFAPQEGDDKLTSISKAIAGTAAGAFSAESLIKMLAAEGAGAVFAGAANLPRVAEALKAYPKVRQAIDVASRTAIPSAFTGMQTMGALSSGQKAVEASKEGNQPAAFQYGTEAVANALLAALGAKGTLETARATSGAYVPPPTAEARAAAAKVGGIATPDIAPETAGATAKYLRSQGRNLAAQSWENLDTTRATKLNLGGQAVFLSEAGRVPGTKHFYQFVFDQNGKTLVGGTPETVRGWINQKAGPVEVPAGEVPVRESELHPIEDTLQRTENIAGPISEAARKVNFPADIELRAGVAPEAPAPSPSDIAPGLSFETPDGKYLVSKVGPTRVLAVHTDAEGRSAGKSFPLDQFQALYASAIKPSEPPPAEPPAEQAIAPPESPQVAPPEQAAPVSPAAPQAAQPPPPSQEVIRPSEAPAEAGTQAGPARGEPGWVGNIPTSEISVDAPRFQFKANVGQGGAGEELRGVQKWDPEKAGILAVWRDPADGKTYVVNGHHRVELAQRTGAPEMAVRYLDAKDAREARLKGALINIAEGRGESTDAARIFRDSDMTPADLAEHGVSPIGKIAKEGMALSRLAQPIFDDVMSGELSPARGAVIGAVENHADQQALYDLSKSGKRPTNDQLAELIRLKPPSKTETTQSLFGEEEITRSLLKEKAEVSDYIRKQLAQEKKLFGTVSSQAAAEKLAEQGNVIKATENAGVAERANQGIALYDKLSTGAGPVNAILDRAAEGLADGESATEVKQRAYRAIRDELAGTLKRLTSGAAAVEAPHDRGAEVLDSGRPLPPDGDVGGPQPLAARAPFNESEILSRFTNPEDGVEAVVKRGQKGFDVDFRDSDADESIELRRGFATQAAAEAWGKDIAAQIPIGGTERKIAAIDQRLENIRNAPARETMHLGPEFDRLVAKRAELLGHVAPVTAANPDAGYEQKLLGERLTAQFNSGMAARPPKLKPAKQRGMFEDEEGPEQGGLFSRQPLISAARSESGGIHMGADPAALADILGSNLYGSQRAQVITKELAQNSLDAIRGVPNGHVQITIDHKANSVSVEDNGLGMTRGELETVFSDLGRSGKREDVGATGGFGIAKAAPFMMSDQLEVETVGIRPDGAKERSRFIATPEAMKDPVGGVKVTTTRVTSGTPTGTKIRSFPKKRADENEVSMWGAQAFARELGKSTQLPGKLTIKVIEKHNDAGSEKTEDLRSPQLIPLDSGSVPGSADFSISTSGEKTPFGKLFESVPVYVSNNGVYQFTTYVKAPSQLTEIPDTISVNIKPTVAERSAEYPFTANRESLMPAVNEAITRSLMDKIIAPAAQRLSDFIKWKYSNLPVIAGTKGSVFYDSGGRLTPSEAQEITENQGVARIANVIHGAIEQIRSQVISRADRLAETPLVGSNYGTDSSGKWGKQITYHLGDRITRTGVVMASKLFGVNIQNPAAGRHHEIRAASESTVFVNPFGFADGDSLDEIAEQIWHTIKHEVVHDAALGHDQHFTVALSWLDRTLGPVQNKIRREIFNAIAEPVGSRVVGGNYRLRSDFDRAVQVYRNAIGRPETERDVLGGTESRVGGHADQPRSEAATGGSLQNRGEETLPGSLESRRPHPDQLNLFDERATTTETIQRPQSTSGAFQFNPDRVPKITDAIGVSPEGYYDGAKFYPTKLDGHSALMVNNSAMDTVLATMGRTGLGASSMHILGVTLEPREWGRIVTEADKVRSSSPDAFTRAVTRIADQIKRNMAATPDAPLIIVQAGQRVSPRIVKRAAEEEVDHATQMNLPAGLFSLPKQFMDSDLGKLAEDNLVKSGYTRPDPASRFYAYNRGIMSAEIGARLMRPGRHRELGYTDQQAREAAGQYIKELTENVERDIGKPEVQHRVKSIMDALAKIEAQIYETVEATRPKFGGTKGQTVEPGRPRGVEAQPPPGAESVRGGRGAGVESGAGPDVSGDQRGGVESRGQPRDNESVQDQSWREWAENFNRVAANPAAASEKDLRRALGYLDHARRSLIRRMQEQGKRVDPNVLAGYDNEEEYYKSLLKQRESGIAPGGPLASRASAVPGPLASRLSPEAGVLGLPNTKPYVPTQADLDLQDAGAIADAMNALRTAMTTPDDANFGEKIRTMVTGVRDVKIAETNHLREQIRREVPNHVQQEALTLMRDFRSRPGELQDFRNGTHPYFATLSPPARADALAAMQKLAPVIDAALNPTPAMQKADQDLTDYFTERLKEGKRLGFIGSNITPDEYINHIMQPEWQTKRQQAGGKAPIIRKVGIGPRNFQHAKTRYYPTILHAISNGVPARTLNATDALTVYGDKFAGAYAARMLAITLRHSGFGKWGFAGDQKSGRIPADWVELGRDNNLYHNTVPIMDAHGNPRVAHQGLYVPPEVADALTAVIDPNCMSRVPFFMTARMYAAYIKAAQLGLSVFHLRALGMAAIENQGIGGLLESAMAERHSPEFQQMEKSFIRAGGQTPILGKTVEAYKAMKPTSLPTLGQRIRSAPAIKQVDQAAGAISHLTFDVIQRKFKVLDFSIKDAKWLAAHPNASPEDHFEAQRQIAKEVNAVYGGLNWENMGMNRAALELSRAIFMAPDWSYSNVALGKYGFQGGPGGNASRLFWLKSALWIVGLNIATSLLMTGRRPKDPTQVLIGKNSKGQDLYENMYSTGAPGDLITLIKNSARFGAFIGPAKSIANKQGAIGRTAEHIMMNEDALGRRLTKPGDSFLKKTGAGVKEAALELAPVPFGASTIGRMYLDKNKHSPLEYGMTAVIGKQSMPMPKK